MIWHKITQITCNLIAILIASFEEPLTRPHSEAKTWAPSSIPSAPQSAPPELAAQHKSQHSQHSGYKSPESESVSLGSFSGINGHKDLDSERDSPLPTNTQDVPTKDEKVRDETMYIFRYIRTRTYTNRVFSFNYVCFLSISYYYMHENKNRIIEK